MPEGVDSFVVVATSPAKIYEALGQTGPTASLKEQLNEIFEKVKSRRTGLTSRKICWTTWAPR